MLRRHNNVSWPTLDWKFPSVSCSVEIQSCSPNVTQLNVSNPFGAVIPVSTRFKCTVEFRKRLIRSLVLLILSWDEKSNSTSWRQPLVYGLVIGLNASPALADGIGLIGFGKTMYQPACAFACRSVISRCPLSCTPKNGPMHGSGHAMTPTPPTCYVSDQAFLRTLAICIDTYCPTHGDPRLSVIEDYWASHLATGTIANYEWKPVASYTEALAAARKDEAQATGRNQSRHSIQARHGGHEESAGSGQTVWDVNSSLPVIKSKAPLKATSFIALVDWQKQYNGQLSFEMNEAGHSRYTLVLILVALFLPVAFSLFRLLPLLNRSRTWTFLNSVINYPPLWGQKHRQPMSGAALGGGFMPTRGQAVYITVISLLNLIFLIAPYHNIQPQSVFATLRQQEMSTIGNRAGVLAMGNVVALFVFASRNNVLLNLTGWHYDTFLLFHRWLGYWAIIQTVLHSAILLAYYNLFGDYANEVTQTYWIWGIVATLSAVALWPASVLAFRRRFYKLFLSTHHLLVVLFLVGYYHHIWYRYEYKWGYEIWLFIAVAVWVLERVIRVVRMAFGGWRTATVSVIPNTNSEYLRVDIDGIYAHGVVYLYFPTLTVLFWQNHPFSVASSFAGSDKTRFSDEEATEKTATTSSRELMNRDSCSTATSTSGTRTRATIVIHVRSCITARLASRAAGGSIRLPVLVEGSYGSAMPLQLSQCSSLLCIAGGVGVSAVLPLLHEAGLRDARLCWGMRNASLLEAFKDEIASLSPAVQVETSIRTRLSIADIVKEELCGIRGGAGPVGVVVCGPPGMADDVRLAVTKLARNGSVRRGVVLLDETFAW